MEVRLHRTQVYLEDNQYELLRSLARRKGKSLAAVLRDILDAYLKAPTGTAHSDPFRRVIGLGEGDGAAVAENYEDYLYGEEP
jgi:spermidine synthase